MHPFGTYLAITDSRREHGWSGAERRASFAPVDATPLATLERRSFVERLVAVLRRRILRAAGA